MNALRPPYLRTTRIALILIHLAGIAGIVSPYIHDMSPLEFLRVLVTAGPWSYLNEWAMVFALVLPLFLAVTIWGAQVRSLFGRALLRWERGLALACALTAAACLQYFVGWSCVRVLGHLPWPPDDAAAVTTLLALGWGGLCGAVALLILNRRRPLHPAVAALFWPRFLYAIHMPVPVMMFAWGEWQMALQLGGWLCLFVAILYAVEATIFIIFGRRHPSGTASHRILQYWLPTPDADPRPDAPVCANCGYDLRGTIPAGVRICPECGTAVIDASDPSTPLIRSGGRAIAFSDSSDG